MTQNVFDAFRPPAVKLPECTCGHLQYTHRYLGGKLACAAVACPCAEYTETKNA